MAMGLGVAGLRLENRLKVSLPSLGMYVRCSQLSQLQSLMLHKPLVVRIEEKEGTHGGPGAPGSIGEFYFQVPTEAEKWLVAYAFLRLGLVPLKCLVFCKDVAKYAYVPANLGLSLAF